MAKPSHLPAEQFHDQIGDVMAIRSDLAAARCVESFDANLNENGRLHGRVSLRHADSFRDFNDILNDHPIKVIGIYSEDHLTDEGDHFDREIEVRVLFFEE